MYLPFASSYNLRITCKQQWGLFKKLIIPVLRKQLQEILQRKGIDLTLDEFLHLGECNGCISGGSLWALLLGENWDGDIDVFFDSKFVQKNDYTGYLSSQPRSGKAWFEQAWAKTVGSKIISLFPNYSLQTTFYKCAPYGAVVECYNHISVKAENHNKMVIQRVKLFDFCLFFEDDITKQTDRFDIVGCGCIYDGKSIYVPAPIETLNKRSRLRVENLKYGPRGLSLAQLNRLHKYIVERGVKIEQIDPNAKVPGAALVHSIIAGKYKWDLEQIEGYGWY